MGAINYGRSDIINTERETVLAIRDAIRYAKLTANSTPCYRTWERMGRGA